MRPSKHHRPFRHATERLLDVLLLKGWVAGLSWRLGGHGRLGVTRHEVDLGPERRLPRPLRIAFASDFHAGPTTAPAIFDVLLEQVRRERPDVLLLGGDYISFDAANIRALRTFLVQARTPLGTYAVLGNHDVWNGSEEVSAALAAAGVEVLVNRNVALPEPFGDVSICGIDDPWTGTPALDAAFAGAGPVRVYLMHSPDGMALLDGSASTWRWPAIPTAARSSAATAPRSSAPADAARGSTPRAASKSPATARCLSGAASAAPVFRCACTPIRSF